MGFYFNLQNSTNTGALTAGNSQQRELLVTQYECHYKYARVYKEEAKQLRDVKIRPKAGGGSNFGCFSNFDKC